MNIRRFCALFLMSILFTMCGPADWVLIDNGTSAYKIVIPENANEVEQKAAAELQDYLKQISGIELAIVDDNDPFDPASILIGNTRHLSIFENAPLQTSLGEDGLVLRNEGPTLLVYGGSRKGTLYAVYTLLESYLGCRFYTPDAIVIPEQNTVRLPQLDVKQVPVFTLRQTWHKFVFTSQEYTDWHKLHNREDMNRDWGMWVHTFQRLVPHEKYFDDHPEYFSEIGGQRIPGAQLCLTNPDVYDVLVKNLREMMAEKPEATYWSVSQDDNYSYCTCDDCKALDEKYGAHAGSVLEFVNRVAREFPDKIISTLAYQYSRSAPVGIEPEENVNIMFCSIECNRSRPLETDPGEVAFRKDLQDWGAMTDNIVVWDYVVQFRNYMNPFPNLHVLRPNLQFFEKNNCRMMFQQGSGRSTTEFYELRTYMIAKLLWDPYTDIDAVMDDFLNGYYGAAGPHIRSYIDLMHEELIKSGKRLDIYGYPYDGVDGYLAPQLLPRYQAMFDEAEAAVQDDPELLHRVRRARLPVEFAILDISLHNVDENLTYFRKENGKLTARGDMIERVKAFAAACSEHGIERLEEHGFTPDRFKQNVVHLIEKAQSENRAYNKPVRLLTEWSEKYPVGGAKALTDGMYGTMDYHYNWLGFEDADMEAVIDLEEEMEVSEIRADFMRLHTAWIFLPKEVMFSISKDGSSYQTAGKQTYSVKRGEGDILLKSFGVTMDKEKARYVRVHAKSIRTCPDWHPGSGGKAWIFTDEIVVR